MKRWTMVELETLSDRAFIRAVLNERLAGLHPYAPLARRIKDTLARLGPDSDLLAAAPDLLAACRAILAPRLGKVADCPADIGEAVCSCGLHMAMDLAEAAVRKATGEPGPAGGVYAKFIKGSKG